MEAFVAYRLVERVIARGETKSSVLLRGGFQADLRVVPRESLGAALQYFTGSKSHNIALRDRALQRGFKLNEYGLFRADDGTVVAGGDEEGIYEALGLALVPPELRENRGEIAAAESRTLPRLVTVEDLRGDLHMHTTESDGRADLETMARAARGAGLSYIAVTEHSRSLAMANGLDERRALEHASRVRALNGRIDGLTLLRGWRQSGFTVPVLVLTARGSWHETVDGIDSGADDYVAKPFRMEEVLARLRGLIRRATGHAQQVLRCGDVLLDPRLARVTKDGVAVKLTSHEFRVLSYLMHHRDRVVSQGELTEHIYAQDFDRDSNTVEVFIARLRRKLGASVIETVRGLGYRLGT